MKLARPASQTALLALALLAAILIPAPAAQDKAPDFALFLGDWDGTIDIGGMQLRIAVHFKLDDQKALAGTIDSLDQGAMGLPLAAVKVENRTVTFLIDGIPGEPTFKATLDESGKKMAGTFNQAGNEGAIQLVKAEK